MAGTLTFPDGGYRFIPGVFPYSAGVAALSGFELHRMRFAAPVPVEEGFRRIRSHLASQGRPVAALCACELRSPRPFTEAGFADFNLGYVAVLEEWKLLRGGINPVARSNVCPKNDPPAVPGFHAFTYTSPGGRAGFVVAGNGEAPEGKSNYRDHIVRLGDVSDAGLREKASWVFGEQERRLSALGFRWPDVTGAHVYTVHPVLPFAARALLKRGLPRESLSLEDCRPPVVDIEFEMDCRGVARELLL
jgi:hypothetical protein